MPSEGNVKAFEIFTEGVLVLRLSNKYKGNSVTLLRENLQRGKLENGRSEDPLSQPFIRLSLPKISVKSFLQFIYFCRKILQIPKNVRFLMK